MKWKSLLKCFFRSYYRTNTPVVVVVRFYVSPPSSVKIKEADLRKETVPALFSYEICDYLLSFLEMLHHVLINSYRQIVKIDAEKYYSSNPRTVFQFMKWDHYENLPNRNTVHTKTKSFDPLGEAFPLQPKRKRNAKDSRACEGTTQAHEVQPHDRTPACDSALSTAGSAKFAWKKTATSALASAHQEARWRQSREVPE